MGLSLINLRPRCRIFWRRWSNCAIAWWMALSELVDKQPVLLRYRNREVTASDLEFIRQQCATSGLKRGDLARAICRAWNWRQANGSFSEYACYDLLLRLEERGLVTLPNRRARRRERRSFSQMPLPPDLVALSWFELRDQDVNLRELRVRPIATEERLGWRLYMERYHYLGDRPIVGEHLLYVATVGNELVALVGWASAAFRAPLREAYIGWDEATKRRRLHFVANNIRFLVPPWIHVKCLASRVLALNLRRLSTDWQQKWNHPVLLAETFVDARYRGTCYRATNWVRLGETAGRSKRGNEYLHGATKKALFVYPLRRHAARTLRDVSVEIGTPVPR